MLREERLEHIERYVNQQRYVSFHELIETLGASKATIRRDLEKLTGENKIKMIRGGAISIHESVLIELPYEQKQQENVDEKNRIARAAAALVTPNTVIMLDCGTTTRKILPHLSAVPGLHIITNDVAIAADCNYYSNIQTTIIGGSMRIGYYNVSGYFANQTLLNFKADIAFLSADAVTQAGDCMITNAEELEIKKSILQISNKSYLLCDHNKFGTDALVRICSVGELDGLITGSELPAQTRAGLKDLTGDLITA